jgi:hypothetical protein
LESRGEDVGGLLEVVANAAARPAGLKQSSASRFQYFGDRPSTGFSCYANLYDTAYWGGLPFASLNTFRDGDDTGEINPVCLTAPLSAACANMPRINFQKDGLHNPNTPLFNNMYAGNYEEWTVVNRSFSDHAFHVHQNPFLVTAVNGTSLPVPEWHDTIIVPAAYPQPTQTNPISIMETGTFDLNGWSRRC